LLGSLFWPPAVEQDITGRALSHHADGAQVIQRFQCFPVSLGQNPIGRPGADARHAQELVTVGPVDLDREDLRVSLRPQQLRIGGERQVAGRVVDHLLRRKAVVAQQKIGLVEANLALEWRGRVPGEGRTRRRPEGGKVGPAQADLLIEMAGGVEDFGVALIRCADDKLRGQPAAGGNAPITQRPDVAQPGHHLVVKLFLVGDPQQSLRAGGFQVEADPVGQGHRRLNQVEGGARHDLQMNVAPELVAEAKNLGRFDDPLLRACGVHSNAGGEKNAVHPVGVPQIHECAGHLLRREAHQGIIGRGAHRAIGAVVQTGVGQQHLEEAADAASFFFRQVDAAGDAGHTPLTGRISSQTAGGFLFLSRPTSQNRQFFQQVHAAPRSLSRSVTGIDPRYHWSQVNVNSLWTCLSNLRESEQYHWS